MYEKYLKDLIWTPEENWEIIPLPIPVDNCLAEPEKINKKSKVKKEGLNHE